MRIIFGYENSRKRHNRYALMYKNWTPIWSDIVWSSLWDEEDAVMKVFLTMLALKDADDVYRGSAYQLGQQSRKGEGVVLEAWKVLSSPDSKRKEEQEHEGRRIQAHPEGWLILNAPKYRQKMREEAARARNRRAQAAWRARKKTPPGAVEQAVAKLEREGKEVEARRAEEIEERRLEIESARKLREREGRASELTEEAQGQVGGPAEVGRVTRPYGD